MNRKTKLWKYLGVFFVFLFFCGFFSEGVETWQQKKQEKREEELRCRITDYEVEEAEDVYDLYFIVENPSDREASVWIGIEFAESPGYAEYEYISPLMYGLEKASDSFAIVPARARARLHYTVLKASVTDERELYVDVDGNSILVELP